LETRILEAVLARRRRHSERSFGWSALVSLRIGNQLYVRAPSPELYDLASDPGAKKNIYPTNRLAAVRLAGELDSFVKRVSTGATSGFAGRTRRKEPGEAFRAGYMASEKTSPSTRIDPKDRIDVANDMHDASLAIEEGKEATVIPLLLRVVAKDPQIQAAQYYLGIAYSRQATLPKPFLPAQSHRAAAGCTDGAIRVGHLPVRDRRSEWRCLVF